MFIETASSALIPGALFHSRNSHDILFVVEEISKHAQDCSWPMVSFRSITPTRDASAGTLWTLDKNIFLKRMQPLSEKDKDLLWDGYWLCLGQDVGQNSRRLWATSILCGIRRAPELAGVLLSNACCLWSIPELERLSRRSPAF